MKQPLVSVVIPVYNVEQYLEECFSSVVKQSYENIEIILVDDGSTDASGELADTLAAKDSRAFVIHKKNGGLSDARNTGISIAKGEYITFVDSDDWIDVEFIDKLAQLVISQGADVAQCDNTRDEGALQRGSGDTFVLNGKDAFKELIKFKTVSPTAWGKLYKTALFKNNNLKFPTGRLHEDTAILYKLVYLAKKVAFINEALYYYRLNANSIMTASYTELHYSSVTLYHEELDEFILEHQILLQDNLLNRHKAMRILSVLNKIANSKELKPSVYAKFQKEYYGFSIKSRDAVCLVGIVPVSLPIIFRAASKASPMIRRRLGKV